MAAQDASLPVADLLDHLDPEDLHAWQPPSGALNHAVIHSLDVTVALDRHAVAPPEALRAVLDQLTAAGGSILGLDLTGVRLEATDLDWGWGTGGRCGPTVDGWSPSWAGGRSPVGTASRA